MSSPERDRYVAVVRPLVTDQGDGTWRAAYPESDWFVTGTSAAQARQKLHDEAVQRLRNGDQDTTRSDDLLDRHLANPIPGVYMVDKQTYLKLRADPDALERFLSAQDTRMSAELDVTGPARHDADRDEFVCLPGVVNTEFVLRATQFAGDKPPAAPAFSKLADTLAIEQTIAAYVDEHREHIVRVVHFFTGRDIYLRDGSRTEFYWEPVSADFLCMDCAVDTDTLGEYFMLQHDLWARIQPDRIGHLCIGCVETRLGRLLTAADFLDVPVNTDPHPRLARSARLTERLNAKNPTAHTPAD